MASQRESERLTLGIKSTFVLLSIISFTHIWVSRVHSFHTGQQPSVCEISKMATIQRESRSISISLLAMEEDKSASSTGLLRLPTSLQSQSLQKGKQ